jgi:general nucleoside transport system ATP-binding protein
VSTPGGRLPPPRLEVEGLSKRFGTFPALDGVSLRVEPGSVHALLGENGAGKSTLVKCVMGFQPPDSGRIRLGGRDVAPKSPREAQALGVGMVYQHFTLVQNMTVCENLVLARPRVPMVIDWAAERADLARFLERMPFSVDVDAHVRSLSAGERQKVEILKQIYLESRIIILDEPTSVLTPAEADQVLSMLHAMARGGDISVVIITHKFREVTQFADEVTVLRRGKNVGQGRVGDLTPTTMAEMMMGGALPATATGEGRGAAGGVRLRVADLTAEDDVGVPALRGVTLDVHAGEIVGIAAIAGNGQEELVEVLAGQRARTGGVIQVSGAEYEATRAQMRARRVRCLPEEPLRSASVPTMSVAENIALRSFDAPEYAALRWFVSKAKIDETAMRLVDEYRIRTPSIHTPIGKLSGGNVQRAVLARELEGDVDILVVANPCMGLDFGAVAEIHGRIRAARDEGTAVLLVSADLDEVLALSSRVLVMSEGRIVHEGAAEGAQPAVLGEYMAGHGAAPPGEQIVRDAQVALSAEPP